MTENKVFIGVPSYAYSNTNWSINLAMMCCDTPSIEAVVADYQTPIEMARTNLTVGFLATECTHLLFWDNDVLVPRNALNRLLAHDKDMIGGLYFQRGEPYTPTILYTAHGTDGDWLTAYDGWAETGLKKVNGIGTGFLLIKRAVFEKMEAPWFKYQIKLTKEGNITHFGEDLYFCAKAETLGFEIWVDLTIKCGHIMYDIITEDTWRKFNHK